MFPTAHVRVRDEDERSVGEETWAEREVGGVMVMVNSWSFPLPRSEVWVSVTVAVPWGSGGGGGELRA